MRTLKHRHRLHRRDLERLRHDHALPLLRLLQGHDLDLLRFELLAQGGLLLRLLLRLHTGGKGPLVVLRELCYCAAVVLDVEQRTPEALNVALRCSLVLGGR